MEWLVISMASVAAIGLAVGMGLLARRPQQGAAESDPFPYGIRPSIFSAGEHTFYGVLQRAVGDLYTVLGKVHAPEVIAPRDDLAQAAWNQALDRASRVHFDFVLCHRDSLQPAAVVELENRAEGQRSRREKQFIDRAARAAHLTVIHFEEKGGYSVNALRGKILRALDAPVMELTERIEPAA